MRIKRDYDGHVCLVFKDEEEAEKWNFLRFIGMRMICFGNFFNAWSWY